VLVLAVFGPLALVTARLQPGTGPTLLWLWVVFGVAFMGARAVVLLHRAHGEKWMVTGA